MIRWAIYLGGIQTLNP